jgi:hypothetical protein
MRTLLDMARLHPSVRGGAVVSVAGDALDAFQEGQLMNSVESLAVSVTSRGMTTFERMVLRAEPLTPPLLPG